MTKTHDDSTTTVGADGGSSGVDNEQSTPETTTKKDESYDLKAAGNLFMKALEAAGVDPDLLENMTLGEISN